MTNHLIWAAGLLGHLLLLAVLFMRKRVARFPWFTLLILFYLARSIGLASTVRFSGHPAHQFATKMLSDLQLWGVDKVDGAEATRLRRVRPDRQGTCNNDNNHSSDGQGPA